MEKFSGHDLNTRWLYPVFEWHPPNHVTKPFKIQTPLLSGTQMNLVFRCWFLDPTGYCITVLLYRASRRTYLNSFWFIAPNNLVSHLHKFIYFLNSFFSSLIFFSRQNLNSFSLRRISWPLRGWGLCLWSINIQKLSRRSPSPTTTSRGYLGWQ